MRQTTESLTLECILTDGEKLKYGKELSDAVHKANYSAAAHLREAVKIINKLKEKG